MSRTWRGVAVAGLAVVSAALAVAFLRSESVPAERLLADGRVALRRGGYREARRLAEKVIARDPRNGAALLLAAEAAAKSGERDDALRLYDRVPDGDAAAAARFAAAEILLAKGYASRAEGKLRGALAADPDLPKARHRLAMLLTDEGRRWESLPHLLGLVRTGSFDLEALLFLGNLEPLIESAAEVERFRRADPNDPAPLMAIGRTAAQENRRDEAVGLFRRVIAADPGQIEAHAQLGLLLAESGTEGEFGDWDRRVTDGAESHPDVWVARGLWFRRQKQLPLAARCLYEALRRDPDRRAANHLLGQTLAALGRKEEAARFFDRQRRLDEFTASLDVLFFATAPEDSALRRAAEQAEGLNRLWEAWAWYRTAARSLAPAPAWAVEGEQRLYSRVPGLDPGRRATAEAEPRLDAELPAYSGPAASAVAGAGPEGAGKAAAILFEDVAGAAGVGFTYFEDPTPPGGPKRLYELAGGGVGAIDYDADGWPDLYLTQGCSWPPETERGEHLDRLWRNLGGKAADVTVRAGVVETGFGQGVAAGDYDADGFTDLRVANIGANRLFRNNGDGTFADATAAAVAGAAWNTSCLIADLDGDSLPDIYDVTYLRGDDVFERVCPWPGGVVLMCGPNTFEADRDRLWLNLGDGRFEERSAEAGVLVPNGKGLGIAAADLGGTGRLSLLIANDEQANFLFVNETAAAGAPRFSEQALPCGVAFDRDGRPQGSMGVAAGDANGDGRIDFHVTNYFGEPNTLYVQEPNGTFSDDTVAAGLRDPGFRMVGFGTQFLDADLDGREDLVVTNGHLDDHTSHGEPYRMRPQFYRNLGGRFEDLSPDGLGPFFGGEYLGRGLAKLDWDRDGRDDFCVSHLGSPVALLVNRTATPGQGLTVRLRGTRSCRDAFGAVVTVAVGGARLVRQLTAGDGYQASNERSLVFGLGDREAADEVTVRWPSGESQTLSDLAAGGEFLVVEGRAGALRLTTGVARR